MGEDKTASQDAALPPQVPPNDKPQPPPPTLDPAVVMKELAEIKSKVETIAGKKEDSFGNTLLKIIGAVVLAGLTAWLSAYLVRQNAEANRLHERIGERAADAYFEAQGLVDDVYTDLEAFCVNTKQDSKEPDDRAAKLRKMIDSGPFPERVSGKLRTFNNYAQDQMARHAGAELSAEEQSAIRKEGHRLRDKAATALRTWAKE